jgi:hypothetical protein
VLSLLIFIFLISGIVVSEDSLAIEGRSACFLVSGLRREPFMESSALAIHRKYIQNPQVAGKPCTVVDGWDSLDWAINQLPKNSKIEIVQAAHGGKGGTACTDENFGTTSAEDILSSLNNYTKEHRVLFVANSCYSGTLLMKKLAEDEKNKENTEQTNRLSKLCVVVGSTPGNFAISKLPKINVSPETKFDDLLDWISHAKKGQNVLDYFSKNLTEQGMISAGQWSTSGLINLGVSTGQKNPSSTVDVNKIFSRLNSVLSNKRCSDPTILKSSVEGVEVCKQSGLSANELKELNDLNAKVKLFKYSTAQLSSAQKLLNKPFDAFEFIEKVKSQEIPSLSLEVVSSVDKTAFLTF